MPGHAVSRLAAEVAELAGAPVELERPSDPAHGDFATNAALRLARRPAARAREPQRELAAELAERAQRLEHVASAEVAGPGFVNLRVATSWYAEALREVLEAGADYGAGSAERRERIQVEMVSANPTGPVVVSAARNGAYGDAVARLLAFAGHAVEREYYYNDTGRQMDLFRASVEARRRGEDPPEDGYHGEYVAELALEPGDPVPRMLEQIERTLERFRIHFDTWERQSEIDGEVAEALAALPTYEADGAVWVRTSEYGDDKDRVAIRSDGTPTYFAADCAYIRHKLARYDRAMYVLGADHHGYVGRLRAIAQAFGEDPDRVEVLIYQLVHLTRGGEAAKMSKRRGDVVTLDELIDEVGVDAARWYLVNRGPDQPIEIDVDLAAEKSQKNPVYYVQYAHARVAGILRNADGAEIGAEPPRELAVEEKELVKRLAEFPAIAAEAAVRRGPQAIPTYAIRLADDFHRFYHEHRVLESDAQAFRLGLCRATQLVIARCLDLVGVEAPERM
ncbi:MAG TPA: arginine--tRNA ligase [Gaiellaceae bacterium]|nr:arginine--tRNA ligase [Gaiellaceae bacterium]